MDTYFVNLESPKFNLKQKVLQVFILGGTFFALSFSWKFFWPDATYRNRGLLSIATEAGLVALVWAFLMVFFAPTWSRKYKLLVGDESITAVVEKTGLKKWFNQEKTVRKGEIRTILELKTGMGLSERVDWAPVFGDLSTCQKRCRITSI